MRSGARAVTMAFFSSVDEYELDVVKQYTFSEARPLQMTHGVNVHSHTSSVGGGFHFGQAFKMSSSQTRELKKLRYIIDFDGFTVEKKFEVREVGIYDIFTRSSFGRRFKCTRTYNQLSVQERHAALYCIQLHQIPFDSDDDIPGATAQSQLCTYLSETLESGFTAGFKGGHFELDVLNQIGYPNVNIETYGCPKISDLSADVLDLELKSCALGCKAGTEHCPVFETQMFGVWLERNVCRPHIFTCNDFEVKNIHVEKCPEILRFWSKMGFDLDITILEYDRIDFVNFFNVIKNYDHVFEGNHISIIRIIRLAIKFNCTELLLFISDYHKIPGLTTLTNKQLKRSLYSKYHHHTRRANNSECRQCLKPVFFSKPNISLTFNSICTCGKN